MRTSDLLLYLFLTCAVSCTAPVSKTVPVHPGWKNIMIPGGWSLQAPVQFMDSTMLGVDSDVGMIYSKTDSIFIEYDVCGNFSGDTHECSPEEVDEKIQGSLQWAKEFWRHTIETKVTLDTIADKVFVLVVPLSDSGTVDISYGNCSSGISWD